MRDPRVYGSGWTVHMVKSLADAVVKLVTRVQTDVKDSVLQPAGDLKLKHEDVAELERLFKASTQGSWGCRHHQMYLTVRGEHDIMGGFFGNNDENYKNAQFTAGAHNICERLVHDYYELRRVVNDMAESGEYQLLQEKLEQARKAGYEAGVKDVSEVKRLEYTREKLLQELDACFCDGCGQDPECGGCKARRILIKDVERELESLHPSRAGG